MVKAGALILVRWVWRLWNNDVGETGETLYDAHSQIQRQGDVLTCDLWRTAPRILGAIAVRERSVTVTSRRKNREYFVHCVGIWEMSELWTLEEIDWWWILSQFVAKRRKTIFWCKKSVGSYIHINGYQGEWFVAPWLEQLYEDSLIASGIPPCKKIPITSFAGIAFCTFLDYQYFVE